MFLVRKMDNEAIRGVYYLRIRALTFVLVVVIVLESKARHLHTP